MPFRLGKFRKKFYDLSFSLKPFSVERFDFLTVACLFVYYVYLKYLVYGYLNDFPYENSEHED